MIRVVESGKNDFKPNSSIIPFFPTFKHGVLTSLESFLRLKKEVYFKYYLFEDCWYDSLGEDNYDFNKIGGVWEFLKFKKNYNALMNAWRPKLDQYGYFEIVPYENRLGKNYPNEDKMIIRKFEEPVEGIILPKPDGAEIYLLVDGVFELWYKSNLKGFLWSYIDSWFGGTSKAIRRMRTYLHIS